MANCFVFRIDSRAGHPVYIGRGRKDRRGRYVVGTWRRFHCEIAQLIQDGLTRPWVIVADDLSDEKAEEETEAAHCALRPTRPGPGPPLESNGRRAWHTQRRAPFQRGDIGGPYRQDHLARDARQTEGGQPWQENVAPGKGRASVVRWECVLRRAPRQAERRSEGPTANASLAGDPRQDERGTKGPSSVSGALRRNLRGQAGTTRPSSFAGDPSQDISLPP
jgi:hypothetical protein